MKWDVSRGGSIRASSTKSRAQLFRFAVEVGLLEGDAAPARGRVAAASKAGVGDFPDPSTVGLPIFAVRSSTVDWTSGGSDAQAVFVLRLPRLERADP
jgi:hypothetical protein